MRRPGGLGLFGHEEMAKTDRDSRQSTQSNVLEPGLAIWMVEILDKVREGKHNFTMSDGLEPTLF